MRRGQFLAVLMFAVTMIAGAWGQSSDYPQQPPEQQQPDQGYPQTAQSQGPNDQGPGSQGPGSNDEPAQRSEGPAPDVARISLMKGDVSQQRGDTGDWTATSVNAPVMRGDQVATGDNARTEIQLDSTNIVRLAGHSQLKLADLSRGRIQLQVAQGYASYTMLRGNESDVEIDTPNVSVHPTRAGRYRVQVMADDQTDVIVREGEAEITTPEGSTRVKEGDLITIRGRDNPEYRVSAAPAKDDWDQWNRDRDNAVYNSPSVSNTNHNYTGVNDLDNNGRWVYVPGYGNVWQPYQQASWAPYQAGRWVWEPYYGWTWVSSEPWGWAPYHYGRWFLYSGNWCWWPGPVYVGYRPVWSPAFVFFVGFGARPGFAFGFGSIGWFPVGPHDVFYPWYGRGFNRVNVVSVTNINVINRGPFVGPLAVRGRQPFFSNASLVGTNARIRGSITTVSSTDFGRGDFSHRSFGVDERQWREGRVMTANLPVVPSRDNLRVSREGGTPGSVRPLSGGRFYTQHQPPAGPEPFHNQADRVQRVVGSQGINARTGIGEVPRNDRAAGNFGNESRGDVNGRFNRPGGNSVNGNSVNEGPRDNNGWSRFGSPSSRPGGEAGNNSPRSISSPTSRPNDSPMNRNERGSMGGAKPPLELHRPIVTPRQDSRPDTRNDQGYRPQPSRTPDYRNSQPSRGGSPHYSPPPSRSSSSSSHGGSSGRGSHSDSRSSSGHR